VVISIHLVYMALSGFAFAALDLIRKLLAGRIDALALVFYMSLGAVPFVAGLAAYQGIGSVSPGYILPGLGALALNLAGNYGFIHSVRLSPLSRTIPLLSLTPAFTAIMAIPTLGEIPSGRQTLGIVLVVAGALSLNSDGHILRPFAGLFREKGALLMVGVALLWSLSGPLDKLALAHASVLMHAMVMTLGVALGALLILWSQRRLSALRGVRDERSLLVAAMIALTLALVFQFLAIKVVFVSLVEAFKRSLGSVMAVVLGRAMFGEAIRPFQIAAVSVMVIGVILILT
jgi:drug/metabolite transporter (DMT)-like permease